MLFLLACTTTDTPDPAHPAPPDDTSAEPPTCGTWATVGHPFVLTYCTSCHSSRLAETSRYGAPVGVDFDTLAAVVAGAEAFSERSLGAEPDMPPRGGVPRADRDAMAAWLACGAPGSEAALPEAAVRDDLDGAFLLTGGVDAREGGVTLYAEEVGAPWWEQSFRVDGDDGSLETSARIDAGVEAESVSFEPPLPVYDGAASAWSGTLTVTRAGATGSASAAEVWTVQRTIEAAPDPRLLEPAPLRVAAEHDGIVEFEWWFSSTRMLVAQRMRTEDGRWAVILHQTPAALRPADAAFPLEDGGSWASRGYWATEEGS